MIALFASGPNFPSDILWSVPAVFSPGKEGGLVLPRLAKPLSMPGSHFLPVSAVEFTKLASLVPWPSCPPLSSLSPLSLQHS